MNAANSNVLTTSHTVAAENQDIKTPLLSKYSRSIYNIPHFLPFIISFKFPLKYFLAIVK